MIRIKARPERGFWRCGVHHPPEWVEHPDGAFTKDQIKILKAEPLLEVEVRKGKAGGKGAAG